MESILRKPLEIVGTSKGDHGRTCGIHPISCGASLLAGARLKIYKDTIEISEQVNLSFNEFNHSDQLMGVGKKRKTKASQVDVYASERLVNKSVMKVYIHTSNVTSCCVGFISRPFLRIYGDILDGRIVEVQRILGTSECESERRRSRELNGLLHAIVVG